MANASRRVVITGLGIISPYGVGTAALMEGLSEGRCALKTLDGRLAVVPPGAGAVLDLPRKEFKHWFDTRTLRLSTMTRQTLLGCVAAGDLLKSMGISPDGTQHPDKGAFLGSFIVPPDFGKQIRTARVLNHRPVGQQTGYVQDDARLADAMKMASAFDFLRALPNMPSSHLSIQTGFQGPACTYLGSDASGLQAIGMAVQMIRSGQAAAMIAGAAFEPFQEVHLAWQSQRALWNTDALPPEQRVRPYSVRAGTLPAEGGAVFYLEERESAIARGATILGEVTGYGQRFIAPGSEDEVAVRADALSAASDGAPDWLAPTGLGRADADAQDVAAHVEAFGEDLGGAAAVIATPLVGFSGPATGPLQLAVGVLAARGAFAPLRGLDVDAAPGCGAMTDALGRSARTGSGARLLASSFSVDGVHAALGVRVEA